jgi:hypothetical protein
MMYTAQDDTFTALTSAPLIRAAIFLLQAVATLALSVGLQRLPVMARFGAALALWLYAQDQLPQALGVLSLSSLALFTATPPPLFIKPRRQAATQRHDCLTAPMMRAGYHAPHTVSWVRQPFGAAARVVADLARGLQGQTKTRGFNEKSAAQVLCLYTWPGVPATQPLCPGGQ